MTGPESQYRDSLYADQFMLQRSKSSRRYTLYRRIAIPGTGESDPSCVHPGMFLSIEAVTQLRGQAGERQVPGLDVALLHGNGGTLSSQCKALLGTEAAL